MPIELPTITINDSTNCSKLTAELILDHFKVDKDRQPLYLLEGMQQGWQGGTICGCVLGGVMALNYMLNEYDATEEEIEDAHQRFRTKFINENGSANCHEILEHHFDGESTDEKIKQNRFCGHLIDDNSTEIVETITQVISTIDPIMQRFARN